MAVSVQAGTITVTNTAATGPGSLSEAIGILSDGDTIAFDLPGTGVHYIQTPFDGYPLITKNNITIDGYTQPGSAPNTASIHATNNAVLTICLTSTNGNALSMQTACESSFGAAIPKLGFGDDEQAILGFFHATNATVKGLAIPAAPLTQTSLAAGKCKAICFAANSVENGGGQCQNWRVSGCWFGVEPTTRDVAYMPDGVTVATPTIAIASYRTINASASQNTVINVVFSQPGTIGVAAGSATPRADFNIFITGWGFDAEGLNYRVAGNFWNVLPDGMTQADMAVLNSGSQLGDAFIEVGRQGSNLTIGTDGDGVNDGDEGNVFAGFGTASALIVSLYGTPAPPRTNFVFAGNYVGVAVDGVTPFDNVGTLVDGFGAASSGRIGSDFDGVSDAVEGNLLYNNHPFAVHYPTPVGSLEPRLLVFDPGARFSFRGNQTVNNDLLPFDYADGARGRLAAFTNYSAPYLATNSPTGLIPVLAANNVLPTLGGNFAPGRAPYTNITIDVYQLDPEGWENGKLFELSELIDAVKLTTNGFPQGKKYLGSFAVPNTGSFNLNVAGLDFGGGAATVTANYSADPVGTHNPRTHTSDFSMPGSFTSSPVITATRSGSNLTIAWSADFGLFTLQSSPVVSPTTWTDVSPQPPTVAVGNQNTMTVPIELGKLFFRLAR